MKKFGALMLVLLPALLIAYAYWMYFERLPQKLLWRDLSIATSRNENLHEEQKQGDSDAVRQWGLSGVVGDSFGGLTALFSALAFWGVFVTLGLQLLEFRRSAKVIVDEHFPLLVQSFKPGCLSVMANAKGEINACVRLAYSVANASANVALYVKRRQSIVCREGKKNKSTIGSVVKQLNFHKGDLTLSFDDTVFIRDTEQLKRILEILSGRSKSTLLTLRSAMVYKSFFGACGKSVGEYRINLLNFQADKVKAQGLLGVVSSGLKTTNAKLVKILGPSRELPMRFKSSFNGFGIKTVDEEVYDMT